MAVSWEYARLYVSREPEYEGLGAVRLQLPADEWCKVDWDKYWETFNRLGSDGWELIGPPTEERGVFTYKAATGVWHDRSVWLERTYLFKRQKR